MLVVDLRRGVCYQRCHDPDCRGYRCDAFPCLALRQQRLIDCNEKPDWWVGRRTTLDSPLRGIICPLKINQSTHGRSPPVEIPRHIVPAPEQLDQIELDAALADAVTREPGKWG